MFELVGILGMLGGAVVDAPTVEELVVSPAEMIVARTIAGEARGEDRYGQALVADVIHERSIRRGLSPESVCLEAKQFAGSKYAGNVTQFQVWLAKELMRGRDIVHGSTFTHFWSGAFAPAWSQNKPPFRWGGHYFIEL